MNDNKLISELKKSGELIYTTSGVSMYPMLRHRRDIVHIKKANGVLKRYDLPLYVRSDSKLVLHRILRVKDGYYIICGDNCFALEKVPFENVKGYVCEFWRNDKHYTDKSLAYRIYVHLWCDFSLIRRFAIFAKFKLKHFVKKLLNRK